MSRYEWGKDYAAQQLTMWRYRGSNKCRLSTPPGNITEL